MPEELIPVPVRITADDIAFGKAIGVRNCIACPLARAIRRLLKPESWALVIFHEFVLARSPECHRPYYGVLPDDAAEWLGRFDEHEPVEPETFRIDLPASYLLEPAPCLTTSSTSR
jgi:hypothetical protein